MSHTLRSMAVTAACVLWASTASAQAPASQTPSSPSPDESTRPATTTFFGDTGIWFVPTAEVVPARNGRRAATAEAPTTSRATRTSPTSPARSRLASRIAPRSSARSWSTRASIATCGRCSAPRRTSAASSTAIPRVQHDLDGRQRRRPLPRREIQPLVRVPTEAGGDGRASHGEAADREEGRRHQHRQGRRLVRLHRQQGNREDAVEVSAFAGYQILRNSPTASIRRTARSSGAPDHVPVSQPAADLRRVERPRCRTRSTATITGPSLVGTDGSIAPLVSATENLTRATEASPSRPATASSPAPA